MFKKLLTSGNNIIHKIMEKLDYKPQSTSYDMLFKDPKDGCAMYDDVWGAQSNASQCMSGLKTMLYRPLITIFVTYT